uniref:Uncharacterized protein n=1 Tax=Arundo donax TaxID=35708 RepID=A0A0A9A477_ARUDO
MLRPAGVGVGHYAILKRWSDDDEFTLITAAAAFRDLVPLLGFWRFSAAGLMDGGGGRIFGSLVLQGLGLIEIRAPFKYRS